MKKNAFIILLIFSLLSISHIFFKMSDMEEINAKIYYVDHSMLRLIPINFNTECKTTEFAVKKVLNELIIGKDNNDNILRVIPDIENCMTVRIDKNTAIVNFKKSMTDNLPDNRNHKLLMLYSIVNSLTSVDGIDNVEFVFDGKVKDINIAGIDMRETFIPDYFI